MKEKGCHIIPSPSNLKEKIALWEGRKDGSSLKGGKGRSSGHAGRLFLNSLGKASKNGYGLSGERSDGRSHDEVLSLAKKESDTQKMSQDVNLPEEGYSMDVCKDSGKDVNEIKFSTLEVLQPSNLNGTNEENINHYKSEVNGISSSDSCNIISTLEIEYITSRVDSHEILSVDDKSVTDDPTNSAHATDVVDSQEIQMVDDSRTTYISTNSNSSLLLQEELISENSYSPLLPQETRTPKISNSSLPERESLSLKDSSPSLFKEQPASKNSRCTSPLSDKESELLKSSSNLDSPLSHQNSVSSQPQENGVQEFSFSENKNITFLNQNGVDLESQSTLIANCSLSLNDENPLILETSPSPTVSNSPAVSPKTQIATDPSGLEENDCSTLPTENEEASVLPPSRESNFLYPTNGETNGYRASGRFSDEELIDDITIGGSFLSSTISRHRPSSFRNEDLSIYLENETLKLELEMKEEKIAVLARELSDLNFTGKAEEEVALLKKAKHDLELKVKDQEEELDDLAGQVQMLEAARIRLEMSIEQTRKENRRELGQRDEEMEEVRVSAQKKIKALEAQLESEHDERTALVREKHDLERRLVDAHSRSFASVDEEAFHRVKKELKKTKALLKDTQTMLEKTQSEGSNKLLMRQLKTQLEDAEFAKNAAIKARQSAESDFSELQSQLEEALRAKKDTEDKLARVTKEKSEVQTQLEESEEEVAEVMKKYKATVSQLSVDQVNMSEQAQLIADLEHDKQVLQDRLTELSSKVEVLEGETANIHTQRRLQMKIKELESKLDLELTTRQRLESQITRLKDQVEKVSSECDSIRLKEMQAMDHGKKLGRQLREAKEDASNLQQKLTDSTSRKQEIEKQYELAESEIMTLKSDLKLAFKRIEDLQQALQGDLSDSDTEMSESGSESDLSLTSFLTASASTSRSSERTSSATTTAAAAVAAPNTEQVPQETPLTGKDPDSTSHDLRIRDVVVGGASLMTSIREEGGKESYA